MQMPVQKGSAEAAIAAKLGQMLLKQLLDALQRDRENRYSLLKPWTLPRVKAHLPDYEDDLFLILDSVVTVKPYSGNVCDGCSLAPDTFLGFKMILGALFHDPWSLSMDRMAKAWEMPVRDVRRIGDGIFYGILIIVSPSWLARTYYRFVRAFGGGYHRIMQAAAVAVIVSMCGAGCSGCAAPESPFEDPSTFTFPEYEQTAGGDQ